MVVTGVETDPVAMGCWLPTWMRAGRLSDASTLGDEIVTAALIEDPDLHDHLMKGLFETKLAS